MNEDEISVEMIVEMLPEGWEAKARETGAITRSRKIKNACDLLFLVLLYLTSAGSYGKTSAMIRLGEGIKLNKNSIFERFQLCGEWLKWMCEAICRKVGYLGEKPVWLEGRRVLLVDATDESLPGSDKADWRLHYAMELFDKEAAEIILTTAKEGETLSRFNKIQAGDIVTGDRAYGTITSIEHVLKAGADYCIRLRSKPFNFYQNNGQIFNLRGQIENLPEGSSADYRAFYHTTNGYNPIRLCVYRKTAEQCTESQRKIKKSNHSDKRTQVSECQDFYSKYIVIATSLEVKCENVLELYRQRWQIELLFKRLKSIFGYDQVPTKSEASTKAWFYGKLLLAAICEALVNKGRTADAEKKR